MKARPRQAVGYIRVSTTRQADSGHSPETQADMIARHCEASGWVLGATERDVGKTGRTARNRPGLDAAIAQVCREEGVLVVASLTRLSRSVKDACQILARLHDCKADLAVISGGMDTTTISGRLLFQIMAAIAEFESDQIGERVRDAQAYMLQKNGTDRTDHSPQALRWSTESESPIFGSKNGWKPCGTFILASRKAVVGIQLSHAPSTANQFQLSPA